MMSFIGYVGNLMANSSQDEILTTAFGGVEKMLNEKNFPQSFYASGVVAEELLQPYLRDMDQADELEDVLNKVKHESQTSKVWVDCWVIPVFLIMIYVRADRGGDWALRLYVVT